MDLAVFTDLPFVELFLNGVSQGVNTSTPLTFATFSQIPYTPGNLTAVGRETADGPILATHTQLAPTEPYKINLSLDAPSVATGTGSALLLDGHDAGMVRATVVDANGNVVNYADNLITFTLQQGPGRVYGVHNGNASSHDPILVSSRYAYHGLARAVVKVTVDAASVPPGLLGILANEIELDATGESGGIAVQPGSSGTVYDDIVITASAPGIRGGKVTIPVYNSTSI